MIADEYNGGSQLVSANASDMAASAHADIVKSVEGCTAGEASRILDPARLARLEGVAPFSKLEQIIRLYLIDVELHLARIVEARASRDFPKIGFEARSISEMAARLGAMQMSAAGRRLEHACQDGHHASVYALISALNESCAAMSAALRHWITDRQSEPTGRSSLRPATGSNGGAIRPPA